MDKLYIVVPCYKEQEVLPETARRLQQKMESLIENGAIHPQSRVVFVNDGSTDNTWQLIQQLHEQNPLFEGINLSCNRGHQNALLAGLMTVKEYADMTISMDADLQDDIDAVDEMVQKYYGGCDIVYGVRSKRATDTWFKRTTAEAFYHVMEGLGARVVFNHADYRLMSRRALEGLAQFKEVNLFLRGLVPLVGYPSDIVYYERHERFAGESKYPLKKMLSFAFEGITSLTTKPIRMIMMLGFGIFAISLCMIVKDEEAVLERCLDCFGELADEKRRLLETGPCPVCIGKATAGALSAFGIRRMKIARDYTADGLLSAILEDWDHGSSRL